MVQDARDKVGALRGMRSEVGWEVGWLVGGNEYYDIRLSEVRC